MASRPPAIAPTGLTGLPERCVTPPPACRTLDEQFAKLAKDFDKEQKERRAVLKEKEKEDVALSSARVLNFGYKGFNPRDEPTAAAGTSWLHRKHAKILSLPKTSKP